METNRLDQILKTAIDLQNLTGEYCKIPLTNSWINHVIPGLMEVLQVSSLLEFFTARQSKNGSYFFASPGLWEYDGGVVLFWGFDADRKPQITPVAKGFLVPSDGKALVITLGKYQIPVYPHLKTREFEELRNEITAISDLIGELKNLKTVIEGGFNSPKLFDVLCEPGDYNTQVPVVVESIKCHDSKYGKRYLISASIDGKPNSTYSVSSGLGRHMEAARLLSDQKNFTLQRKHGKNPSMDYLETVK